MQRLQAFNYGKTQAQFACVGCAYEHNADRVGAMKLLAWGYRVAGFAEESAGLGCETWTHHASSKQDPTVATMSEATHA